MARRVIAGGIFVALGLGLLGSQLPLTPERTALAVAALILWVGTGLLILLRPAVGRALGAVISIAGLVAGGWAAALANDGAATLVAETFFTPDGPTFSWIEVFVGSAAFAALSAIGGLLLLTPLAPRSVPSAAAAAGPPEA